MLAVSLIVIGLVLCVIAIVLDRVS